MVQGTVASGFEPVRDAFAANFEAGLEVGAACAVYFRGEKVVDLWGGVRDPKTGDPWKEDTMVCVCSTTKGVSSMALAVAHSRGLFDYDEKMATYWPEFAQGGKADITVRQILSHQAGLPAVTERLDDMALLADPDRVAAAIAKEVPAWIPGEHHGYHGGTLGWYGSELVRRVDPQHRTLARYFADEVARPLGLEFYIGLPASVDRARIAPLLADWYTLRLLFHMNRWSPTFALAVFNPFSLTYRVLSNPRWALVPSRYNDEDVRALELCGTNGIGQVRDIAKAYGTFAIGGGALDIKPATLEALEKPAKAPTQGTFDVVLRQEMSFSLGYCKPVGALPFGSSSRAYGTPGLGGSFAYADPDTRLGFAYAMNRMDFYPGKDPRETALSDAAQACAARA